MSKTQTLTQPVRIATAGGDATFVSPKGTVHSNDIGRGWLELPEGTEVQVCATFEKTHTFFVTFTIPQEDEDEVTLTQGAVLRKASFDKLQEALD